MQTSEPVVEMCRGSAMGQKLLLRLEPSRHGAVVVATLRNPSRLAPSGHRAGEAGGGKALASLGESQERELANGEVMWT